MAITKIILQQMVTMDQNSVTASKYPKYTIVLGNTISSITAAELTSAIESSKASAAAAKQSEINAKQSELNAKDSENEAEISAASSQQSATQSASSATASANSAKAAKTSETNAKASETAAKTSETKAKASETAAKTSETNANSSKAAAAASASAAKTSETNAAASASAAKTSETNANSSKTAAANSASAAKTSETNAKTSETNAAASATKAESVASGMKASIGLTTARHVSDITVEPSGFLGFIRIVRSTTTGYPSIASSENVLAGFISAMDGTPGYVGVFVGDYTGTLYSYRWTKNIGAIWWKGVLDNQINRYFQLPSGETQIKSGNGNYHLYINDLQGWGAYDNISKQFIPLAVAKGGTGGRSAAEARTNLQLNRFQRTSDTRTIVCSTDVQADGCYLQVDAGGQWGVFNPKGRWQPLAVPQGGTGANDTSTARTNLQVMYEAKTGLDANTNLDDIKGTTAGFYYQPMSANAKPELNYPIQLAGALLVQRTGANGSDGCIQSYFVYNNSSILYKRIYTSTQGWSVWKKIVLTERVEEGELTTYVYSNYLPSAPRLQVSTSGLWGCHNGSSWVPLTIAQGGTGAASVDGARTNLGLGRDNSPQLNSLFLDRTSDSTSNYTTGGMLHTRLLANDNTVRLAGDMYVQTFPNEQGRLTIRLTCNGSTSTTKYLDLNSEGNLIVDSAILKSTLEKPLQINSANPSIRFNETDRPANTPAYTLIANGGNWFIHKSNYDDAGSTSTAISYNFVNDRLDVQNLKASGLITTNLGIETSTGQDWNSQHTDNIQKFKPIAGSVNGPAGAMVLGGFHAQYSTNYAVQFGGRNSGFWARTIENGTVQKWLKLITATLAPNIPTDARDGFISDSDGNTLWAPSNGGGFQSSYAENRIMQSWVDGSGRLYSRFLTTNQPTTPKTVAPWKSAAMLELNNRFTGNNTFTGALESTGDITCARLFSKGTLQTESGGIELYHPSPFIDFHFNKATSDYTARIINDAADQLTFACQNVRTLQNFTAHGLVRGCNNDAFVAWPTSDPSASNGQIRIAPRFQSRFNSIGSNSSGAARMSMWFEEHVGSNHRGVVEVSGYGASTQYWHFRSDGAIWNSVRGEVTWGGTSDLRYKDNVVDYDGLQSLENIKAMNLIKFTYKDDDRKRERRGVAAQQIMEIDPCYVKKSEGSYIDANGEQVNIEKLVLDTNPLLMDALCAIKVLSAQVGELKEENADLRADTTSREEQITALESEVSDLKKQIADLTLVVNSLLANRA